MATSTASQKQPSAPEVAPRTGQDAQATTRPAERAQTPYYLRLCLDRSEGVVLELLDALGRHQQSVTLDGTTLTLRVYGPAGQSTLVQTADRIALFAQQVSIEADTVSIRSRRGTTVESQEELALKSAAGLKMETPGKIVQQGAAGLEVDAQSVSVRAGEDIRLHAQGGMALSGVAQGVQLRGSSVDLTAVRSTVTAMQLELLGFAVNLGTPSADADFTVPAPEPT